MGVQISGCRCGCKICDRPHRSITHTLQLREIGEKRYLLCSSCSKKTDDEVITLLRERRTGGLNPLSVLKRAFGFLK